MTVGCAVGWEGQHGTQRGRLSYGPTCDGYYGVEEDGYIFHVHEDDIFPLDHYNLIFMLDSGKKIVERYPIHDYREDEIRRLAIPRRHENQARWVLVKKGARWLVEF